LARDVRGGCSHMTVLFWWFAITAAGVGFILVGMGVAEQRRNRGDAGVRNADGGACPKCGYVLRSATGYCGHCGHHVTEDDD